MARRNSYSTAGSRLRSEKKEVRASPTIQTPRRIANRSNVVDKAEKPADTIMLATSRRAPAAQCTANSAHWAAAGVSAMAVNVAAQAGCAWRNDCVRAAKKPDVAARKTNSSNIAAAAARNPATRFAAKKRTP